MGKICGLKDLVEIFAVIIGAFVIIVCLGVIALVFILGLLISLIWYILKKV